MSASLRAPYVSGGAKGVVTITANGRVTQNRLKTLADVLPKRAERVGDTNANLVAYWAREFAPEQEENDLGFKNNERHLTIKEGIVVRQIAPLRWAVIATAPQSAPQEFGSIAHVITPKTKDYLHFYWQGMGTWARFKSVNHPGNPPHPFMLPARRRVAATFYKHLRQMFDTNGLAWQGRR